MVAGFSKKTIKPARTVGQRLRNVRRKKGLTLEAVEQLTKIKLKYLRALEEDRHDLLPTEVYSLGFLRCYGEALGLSTKKLLDQYRSERSLYNSTKRQDRQRLAPARRIAGPKIIITPKTLILIGSLAIVLGLAAYIAIGLNGFLAAPALALEQPAIDARVTTNTIKVKGKTDPAATLQINGEIVTLDSNGQFDQAVALMPGLNSLEVVVTNRVGKETKQTRKVLAEFLASPVPGPSLAPSPSPSSILSPTPQASPSLKARPSP